MAIQYDHDHDNEVTLFAETNFRNQRRRFGIKTDDRRRHMYILGKTGMGKTVLQENMVLSDIMAGHGVCYIDPHGDTAEKILDYIPSNRINDVVYFNPADMEFPVGFNILETTNEEQKHLVASGLMGVFKKIWPDVWSPRMEYILLNCVLALLDYPGATLLGINRLLVDKEYRSRVIAKIRNPIVKTFWVAEFTSWSEKYATEAIAPVQNKVGQFLSASIIRNIVAQVKSTINPRQIMDEGKIFIVNLSKGKIGEDNMRLLGGMIVTKIQLAAMERVDIKNEDDRRDFYLFVDEFQNFANESFASVLSEARKYHLNLTVAHQYIEQLEEEVRDAVFGNVGTMMMFRVGAPDATFLETEFAPTFTPEDLTNLTKYQIYLKLMVDGVATQPFSANTLPPIAKRTGSEAKVIAVSRERYAQPRDVIEEKVLRWSGMETGPAAPAGDVDLAPELAPNTSAVPGIQYPSIMTEDEQVAREALGGVPASMKPGTPEYARAGVEALEGAGTTADTGEYLRISPERMAALAKPAGSGNQPKKEKPKFKHTCSRCGKTWDMPIQLDPTRPMYCAECMPIVREERKGKEKFIKQAVRPSLQSDMQAAETVTSAPPALDAAMRAMEEGKPIRTSAQPTAPVKREPPPPNRPRIVVTDKEALERMTDGENEPEERSALMDDISRTKGRPMETRKQAVTPPRQTPVTLSVEAPAPVPAAKAPVPPPAPTTRPPRRDQPAGKQGDRPPREQRAPQGNASNRPRIAREDKPAPPQSGNRPVIVRSDEPRKESRTTNVPSAPHAPKAKRSLEEMFGEAEARTDQAITARRTESDVQEAPDDDDKGSTPSVVFRSHASSVRRDGASSSGPRSVAPGQRVQF